MAKFLLLVRPGSPEIPEFVDIKCEGMDRKKTLEFLVNGVVRSSNDIDQDGNVDLSFKVDEVARKAELVDLGSCSSIVTGEFSGSSKGGIFCGSRTGIGDSIGLRYKV